MRTISLSWKAPERMTATSRSPARPAARVSAVAGTKARPRGALRLDQQGRPRGLGRRAAGEEAGAPLREAVEDPDPAIAVEGGDEQVAARAAGADLGVDQRRTVEEARLGFRGQPRSARRDA